MIFSRFQLASVYKYCHLFVLGLPFGLTVPFARTNCPCIIQRKTFLRLPTLSLLIFFIFFQIVKSHYLFLFFILIAHDRLLRVERAQCSLCGVFIISETCLYDHGWKGLALGAIGGWNPYKFF